MGGRHHVSLWVPGQMEPYMMVASGVHADFSHSELSTAPNDKISSWEAGIVFGCG